MDIVVSVEASESAKRAPSLSTRFEIISRDGRSSSRRISIRRSDKHGNFYLGTPRLPGSPAWAQPSYPRDSLFNIISRFIVPESFKFRQRELERGVLNFNTFV